MKRKKYSNAVLVIIGCIILGIGIGWLISHFRTLEYTIVVPASADQSARELSYGSIPEFADYSFFKEVEQSFIEQKAEFITVNLEDMELTLYKEGEPVLEVPVAAKGKMGSWWETPPGLYKILTKERDHVTSFGGLHMPWSMQFNGNFFIHGWTYFPDGREVTGSTSGGCVRLTQEDAEKLYGEVKIGTPVLVYDNRVTEQVSPATLVDHDLMLEAENYLVIDLQSNQILMEKEMQEAAPTSVLSYLMTGLVASEHYPIERIITRYAIDGYEDGSYRTYDLLFALFQEGNESSATALGHYVGKNAFVEKMNTRAQAIGMKNTVFASPGISSENLSSPEDMFILAKHMYNYRSFLLQFASDSVNTRIYGLPYIPVENKNAFSENNAFVGGIVYPTEGFEEVHAGLGIFEVTFKGGSTRPIAFIVMNSAQPAEDIQKMHTYISQVHALEVQ